MAFTKNKRFAVFLIGCAMSMAILGAFIGLQKAEASSEWQPLAEIVDSQQLTDIISENTAPSVDRAETGAAALGYIQGDLLVIDFKTPMLCGTGGCAIAGYQISTGERILTTYANQTSPNQPIVELVDRDGVDLPCLLITMQRNTEETLCYRNEEWVAEGT